VPESVDMESVGMDEDEINLERDLAKLKKIKELLSSEEMVEGKEVELEPAMPEEVPEEEPSSNESAEAVEEEKKEVESEEAEEPEKKEEKEAEETPEAEKDQPKEAVPEEEPPSNESAKAVEEEKKESSFQDVFEKLESCRKGECNGNDGDVSYFEHSEKIVLDGECLISTLNNSFEETKKLFLKLSQTESPKDQFFIKQEIIRHQETLRKAMLKSIRMCEQENCSLPDYSLEILNTDVLKNVLEMVSMQNWSNQKDFTTFDNFMKSLKDSFYSRITPPVEYIQSIIDQLELGKE
jgi:hypothetical protein